jgi:hypothetical protein
MIKFFTIRTDERFELESRKVVELCGEGSCFLTEVWLLFWDLVLVQWLSWSRRDLRAWGYC